MRNWLGIEPWIQFLAALSFFFLFNFFLQAFGGGAGKGKERPSRHPGTFRKKKAGLRPRCLGSRRLMAASLSLPPTSHLPTVSSRPRDVKRWEGGGSGRPVSGPEPILEKKREKKMKVRERWLAAQRSTAAFFYFLFDFSFSFTKLVGPLAGQNLGLPSRRRLAFQFLGLQAAGKRRREGRSPDSRGLRPARNQKMSFELPASSPSFPSFLFGGQAAA